MANIMIVDDTTFMRVMLKNIIEEMGHYVIAEATNGEDAVRQYSICQPDLVTMDITMPDMDGITALKKIKSIDQDAKVIMCSAVGQQKMVIEAISSGAKDFIVKPMQKERVHMAIQKTLQNK